MEYSPSTFIYWYPLIALTIFWIIPGILNYRIAKKKGRSAWVWVIAIFFFSWWSTLILFLLPSKLSQYEQDILNVDSLLKQDLKKLKKV